METQTLETPAVGVAIFLAAVFGYLVLGWEDGVYVVASARSALDCLWWVVLCFVVQREKLPAVTAFLLWGCATWALQWLVCYWVLPRLLFDGASHGKCTAVYPEHHRFFRAPVQRLTPDV